ncbi:MAG: SGNH/GDSL hydrolase family protein [Planctomycetales bacterium]|nr:SGNH/GDSL hydrolase family protein [Planctomycetales bacterium]
MYRRHMFSLALLLLAVLVGVSSAAEPENPWKFDAAELQPFWRGTTMHGESVLFIKEGEGGAKGKLLLTPTKILKVTSSSGEIVYESGKDYVWQPGSKEIVLPAGSKIIWKTPQDLRRPAKSQKYALTHRDGNGEILFGATHEYHDMQTLVTYEHEKADWKNPTSVFPSKELSKTIKLLAEKKTLKIALLGDSISTGCNASGWAKVAPHQPPYQDLLVLNLEHAYDAKVTLENFAVGGTSTDWGVANIGKVIDAKPDLVILAFGMNDSSGRPAKDYQAKTQTMISAVKKALPEAEIILVATILGNKDWVALKQELFPQYRDALASLCEPGIALADMTSVWAEILRHKQDWDLTGNGVNHPNDFGHRIYAQVLSAMLIAEK